MRSFISALGSVLLGVSLLASLLAKLLLLRLRTTDGAYWHALGSPKLVPWLWRGRYADLDDSVTVGVARILKVLVIVFFVGAAVALTLTFILAKSSP